jgi:hypothetical protein
MCHCISRTSQIPHHQVKDIYRRIGEFVSNPLKHPDPEQIRYIEPSHAVPDPLDHDSAESYQSAIHQLAREYPGSIFEYALYAFRSLRVRNPEVYIHAALRDPNTAELAAKVTTLDHALSIIRDIEGNSSIFRSRDRIALPDELVYFNTGHEAEKALLLYTLLRKSSLVNLDSSLLLTKDHSLVMVNGRPVYPESYVSFESENKVGAAPTTISPSATITCPKCGFVKTEEMPTNACVFFYECTNCLDLLKPLPGDCCVFCSYGSVQCPPKTSGSSCC